MKKKTRITTHTEGEQNYHIFYQLLPGEDEALLERLKLTEGSVGFKYLSNKATPKSHADSIGFDNTKECLSGVSLNGEEQRIIFQIVAAVLHVGNLEYEQAGGDDTTRHNTTVTDESISHLSSACLLLGVDDIEVRRF